MVSKESNKRATLHEKLQLLRSITHSQAMNKASIIIDATKYIEELKEKVERLNQEVAAVRTSVHHHHHLLPLVRVETLEKGFLVRVFLDSTCPGLLVFILEAFEEVGIHVQEARVSCTDSFRLQAVISENGEEDEVESINAQAVKQTVLQAIKNWSQSTEQNNQILVL